jgi:hypothetical protein
MVVVVFGGRVTGGVVLGADGFPGAGRFSVYLELAARALPDIPGLRLYRHDGAFLRWSHPDVRDVETLTSFRMCL